MPNPEIIVFDLGGVLIQWDPRHLYRKVFDDEAEMEYFLTHVCNGAWNAEQDAGRPFAEGIALLQADWPQYAAEIQLYFDRWIEMVPGAVEDTVEVLTALRDQGVPLYALTNWSGETFPLVQPWFDFLGWFEGIVVSGHERLKKPDPRIYERLLTRYDLPAARSVFIDDTPANVTGAESVGMHAIHFTGADALRKSLAAMGFGV